jgi:hypothetical protein
LYSADGADCDVLGVFCDKDDDDVDDVDCYKGGVDCDDGIFIVIRAVLL